MDFFQGLPAQVAAADLTFVVLLGEHGSDPADHGVAVGQDAHHVGAPAQLPV